MSFNLCFGADHLLLAASLAHSFSSRAAEYSAPTTSNFTWTANSKSFSLNGQPYNIIGGQIDPQRVPKEYWSQRIQMAKAMGLNTIFSYLYWQDIEKYQGHFDFTDRNDLASWYKAIADAGMKAVLRPGGYITAERDWGGLPGWLTQISGMQTRANNAPFLNATINYFNHVGAVIQPYLVSNGGPILMAQIENEYGYVGSDTNYKNALSDGMAKAFPGIRQYTNDCAGSCLSKGAVPGALAVVDGSGPKNGIPQIRQQIHDQSEMGPLMDGEVWITWFDAWGPKKGHAGPTDASGDIDWVLSQGDHFSIYMFHGGTSWGFGNGAEGNTGSGLVPYVTSYDYGALLDETGRVASTYNNMRSAIAKHVSNIPSVPSNPPLQSVSSFALTPVARMFDNLPTPIVSSSPKTMEACGTVFGYIMYQHKATASASGALTLSSGGPRDRMIVLVNGVRQGTIDAIYKNRPSVNVSLKSGDTLQLLVENLGRIKSGSMDQVKGIVGSVSVGGQTLTNWEHYTFPFDSVPNLSSHSSISVTDTSAPTWYRGTFRNTQTPGMAADTFLELPSGIKGLVFVNGHNLGRYWTIGPQQQLFLPGAWLHDSSQDNEVLVLELSPRAGSRTALGNSKRRWGNNADPDCSNCS
jgi:beta-galactosidase GanA